MNRPTAIEYLGNQDLLNCPKWGFLASRTIPSGEVLRCYDWATERAAAGDCVVEWQQPLSEGRMLIISTTAATRQSRQTALARNRYVEKLSETMYNIHASKL